MNKLILWSAIFLLSTTLVCAENETETEVKADAKTETQDSAQKENNAAKGGYGLHTFTQHLPRIQQGINTGLKHTSTLANAGMGYASQALNQGRIMFNRGMSGIRKANGAKDEGKDSKKEEKDSKKEEKDSESESESDEVQEGEEGQEEEESQ